MKIIEICLIDLFIIEQWQRIITFVYVNHSNPCWQKAIYPCIKSSLVCHRILSMAGKYHYIGYTESKAALNFYLQKINMLACVNIDVYAYVCVCLFVFTHTHTHMRVLCEWYLVLRERLINVVIYFMSKLIRSQFTNTSAPIYML